MSDADHNLYDAPRNRPWKTLILIFGVVSLLSFLAGRRTSRSRPAPKRRSSPRRESSHERDESWISKGIIGTSRGELAKRFGPPVTASGGDYWQAETWYYPVDHNRRAGIAIRFVDNIAQQVEFIRSPATTAS